MLALALAQEFKNRTVKITKIWIGYSLWRCCRISVSILEHIMVIGMICPQGSDQFYLFDVLLRF